MSQERGCRFKRVNRGKGDRRTSKYKSVMTETSTDGGYFVVQSRKPTDSLDRGLAESVIAQRGNRASKSNTAWDSWSAFCLRMHRKKQTNVNHWYCGDNDHSGRALSAVKTSPSSTKAFSQPSASTGSSFAGAS